MKDNSLAEQTLHETRPLFEALGDKMRQQIFWLLSNSQTLCVKDLAALTNLSRPAVSHHLLILKQAGLVYPYRHGVKNYYQPDFSRISTQLRLVLDSLPESKKISHD